jgi:hypothetical protein
MAKIIKNVDSVSHTYAGQVIEANSSYTIQGVEQIKWANDDDLMSDIGTGKAIVNDGTSDISGVSNQINFLKDIDNAPKDSDGTPLSRTKITATGWHYQLHGVEFETSVLNSIQSKKTDGTNWNFTSIKFYELVNSVETEITGGNLNQTYLDSNCIKTVIDWEPNFDIDIIGGMLKQKTPPSESVDLWIIGAPDIAVEYGGSKVFVSSMDLEFMSEGLSIDGKTPKYVPYNSTYHSGKFRIILRHSAGFKHKLHMIFEIFKA